MRLATNRWNLAPKGTNKPISYYGYKTRKEAQAFAEKWNISHEMKICVIDTKRD